MNSQNLLDEVQNHISTMNAEKWNIFNEIFGAILPCLTFFKVITLIPSATANPNHSQPLVHKSQPCPSNDKTQRTFTFCSIVPYNFAPTLQEICDIPSGTTTNLVDSLQFFYLSYSMYCSL